MSSMRQSTPGSLSSIIDLRRWNNSGALVIRKGSLLKQYLPYGVIKVVRRWDSALSALFASNLLKRVAPVSCARVSSTWGIGNVFQRTFSFRGFKSTHILTSPDRFGTTTMPARTPRGGLLCDLCDDPHHLHSIEFVSNLFTERESDMTWCVQRVWHGIGFQLNGSPMLPSPSHTFGKCLMMLSSLVPSVTVSTRQSSLRVIRAGNPSRLACTSFTTKTLCLARLCPNGRFGRELSRGIE